MSCQVFGKMQVSKKKADKDKAGHIKMLARMFPGLRIAHVDEKNGEFFSVLSKNAGDGTDKMVEEYRIKVISTASLFCQMPFFGMFVCASCIFAVEIRFVAESTSTLFVLAVATAASTASAAVGCV